MKNKRFIVILPSSGVFNLTKKEIVEYVNRKGDGGVVIIDGKVLKEACSPFNQIILEDD